MKDRGRVVRIRGWFQGTTLPPEFRARRRRTSVVMSAAAPRKSIRLRADLEECLTGILTVKNTMMPETMVNGTLGGPVCQQVFPVHLLRRATWRSELIGP